MNRLILAAAAMLLVAPTAHAATDLFFDDFETEAAGGNQSLDNWSISIGAIDVLGGSYFPYLCANATRCIDLDGSTGTGGRIETGPFSFVSGGTYTLSFDYGSNDFGSPNGNSMTFGVTGGLFSDALGPVTEIAPGNPFLSYSQTFTAIGSGSLFFDDDGNDLGGVILDNIRLTQSVSAVPLPAGLVLGMTGLGALAGMGRLRRVTSA
jgi:hypothetical protein